MSGAAGFRDGAHHVDRLIAIERRDLDGHHVFDLREAAPERVRQHAAAHRRLQVEAEHRHHFGHCARSARSTRRSDALLERREAQQPGVVAEFAAQARPPAPPAPSDRRCRRLDHVACRAAPPSPAAAPARSRPIFGRESRTAWCGRRPPRRPRPRPDSSASARAAAVHRACAPPSAPADARESPRLAPAVPASVIRISRRGFRSASACRACARPRRSKCAVHSIICSTVTVG